MAHRITLIITQQSVLIDRRLPHFHEKGHLVIPFDGDGAEISKIEEFAKPGKPFEEVFDEYLVYFWKDDILGESNDLDDFPSLLLVELVARLRLTDFLLFHYQEVVDTVYTHAVNFQDGIASGNAQQLFDNTGIDINNYWQYDSCQRRYENTMTGKD
ncbi:MAG: hypothetical protein AAFV95_17690 [Bacteroidota bacterium]